MRFYLHPRMIHAEAVGRESLERNWILAEVLVYCLEHLPSTGSSGNCSDGSLMTGVGSKIGLHTCLSPSTR